MMSPSLSSLMRLETRRIFVRCLGSRQSSLARSTSVISRASFGLKRPLSIASTPCSRYSPLASRHLLHSSRSLFVGGDKDASSSEARERLAQAIVQHLNDSNMDAANEALVRLEQLTPNDVSLETYTAVLDGWIRHQQQQQGIQDEGPDLVNEMFHAADRAHAILERLERKQQQQQQQQHAAVTASSNTSDNKNEQERRDDTLSFAVCPTQHCYDAVLNAWLTVTRTMLETDTPLRGIPQRAQRLLEQMQQSAVSAKSLTSSEAATTTRNSDIIRPTIHHYNAVMEIWGNSPEHLRGTMAEHVFQQVLLSPSSSELEPNNETYSVMIRAWCRSRQDRAAFNATGHLMKLHRLMGKTEEEMKLSMADYKTILEAWTRAGDKLAPQKAFWVIKLMQKAYIDRVSEIRPDEECYKYVLATYARSTLPNLGHDVDELLDQMEERLLTPDSKCYRYAIETWKNAAAHVFNEGTQHEDATHASRMLTRMEKAYHRSSDVLVQTSTEDFNNVIQAWSTSSKAGAAIHAESLLKKLEKAYEHGDHNLKPDADSYRWALEAWAASPSPHKLNHAITILSRMKDFTEGSKDDHAKPTVAVFNAFIHVCGTSDQASAQDKKYNLKLAVNTVEEMRKRGEAPNSTTFRLLLEACENLLPLGKERSRAVENVFKNCCYLGLVNDEVLAQFKEVASEELFTDLVVANTSEDETEGTRSSKMVPDSWTRNVGVKVVTVDGKKPKPLNVDAMFVVTKRVKEFRVKRLRAKKNKRLLRAGRNLYVKNSRMAN